MITGQQDMQTTIDAMRVGAFDYIRKPMAFEDVLLVIEKVERFKSVQSPRSVPATPLEPEKKPYEIVGADRKIVDVIKQIGLLSRNRTTVLIEGESGTGKELVARALHNATHPGKSFVAINCSAVVPTLPESELFGFEKGAFTGADARKIGKLEYAGEGTVFFDEIGDMSLDLQAKILRVFQEREFQRVGGLESIPFRARVIAATNRDLEILVEEGKFRQDLFYRIAVSRLVVPPLRERRGDIRILARHLLNRIGRDIHRPVKTVEEGALRRLEQYDWPGNVREMENVLTRALTLAHGDVLTPEDLEPAFGGTPGKPPAASGIVPLAEAEKQHIEKALAATGWNLTRTAKQLRISPTTLRKKISDFKLKKPG
jgi:two-component system response regulator AtoC